MSNYINKYQQTTACPKKGRKRVTRESMLGSFILVLISRRVALSLRGAAGIHASIPEG
jgi:hypothetical protein